MVRTSLPWHLIDTLRRCGVRPTQFLLVASVPEQKMRLMEQRPRHPQRVNRAWHANTLPNSNPHHLFTSHSHSPHRPSYFLRKTFRISTSAFGLGQQMNSNQTPLGLHRVSNRIGGGQPPGTVFRGRQPIGLTWKGLPSATIVHRILRLDGLEPGFNKGGQVDSFQRFIYIHGFADESTLGKPQSHGCIHMSANDLIPLFDMLPIDSLVWITADRLPSASQALTDLRG